MQIAILGFFCLVNSPVSVKLFFFFVIILSDWPIGKLRVEVLFQERAFNFEEVLVIEPN